MKQSIEHKGLKGMTSYKKIRKFAQKTRAGRWRVKKGDNVDEEQKGVRSEMETREKLLSR